METTSANPAARSSHGTANAPRSIHAPLLVPAIAFCAGIISAAHFSLNRPALLILVALFATGVLAVSWFVGSIRREILLGISVLVFLGFGALRYQASKSSPANHIANVVADEPVLTRLEGIIVSAPAVLDATKRNPFLPTQPARRVRFVLEADHLTAQQPPTPIRGLVRVTVDAEELKVGAGDRVEVSGWMHPLSPPRNPGEIDFSARSRAQGVHIGLSTDGPSLVRPLPGGSAWRRTLDQVRAFARSRLLRPYERLSEDGPRLLDAMVLGQRSSAGRAVSEAFLRTGTIHFLSVSGFHVGLLGMVTWWLVRRVLRRGPRSAATVTLATLVTYCLLAEPNSPILRATAMGVLACVAILLGRPMSPHNWLAASALGILLLNPNDLFEPGFQLSFVQVAALLIVVPSLARREIDPLAEPRDADTWPSFLRRSFVRIVGSYFLVSFVCWLTALPLTMLHFGQFTPWAALQSCLITPLVSIVTLIGFANLALQSVLPILGGVAGILLRTTTDALVWATDRLAEWPHTYIECTSPPIWLVLAFYAALAAWWSAALRAKRRAGELQIPANRKLGSIGLVLLGAGLAAGAWRLAQHGPGGGDSDFRLQVLAVGNGSAALAVSPSGAAALFDCGTLHDSDAGEAVVRAARSLGIRALEFGAVSHANLDHFSGFPTLLGALRVGEMICSHSFVDPQNKNHGPRRLAAVMRREIAWSPAEAGARRALGPARCEWLWPPRAAPMVWDENDRSLVIRVEVYGRRILIPGDISRDAIRALLERHEARAIDLRCDVLIAPHHGAIVPETAAFYAAVDPEFVVASTAQDRSKLRELIQNRLGSECTLLTTAESGAITIQISPDCRIAVSAFRSARPPGPR